MHYSNTQGFTICTAYDNLLSEEAFLFQKKDKHATDVD